MSTSTSAIKATEPQLMTPTRTETDDHHLRWSRTVAIDIVGFADIAAVAAGAFLPAWIYSTFGGLALSWLQIVQSGLLGGFIAHLLLRNAGMYDINKIHDLPQNPIRLFAALAAAIAGVIGLGMPIASMQLHIFIWYVAWLSASFTLLLATRGIANAVLARLTHRGRFDRNVAVFGAGVVSRRVHDELNSKNSGIRFVGVYDDRAGEDRLNPDGLVVTGKLEDLIGAAYAQKVDDIVIALPQGAESRIATIVRKLEQAPSNVHIVTHIASDLVGDDARHRVSQIGSVGLIDVKERPLADWAPLVKRTEDIIVATIGLVVSLPVIMLAIAAIKLEGHGPVFYRQRRRGLNRQLVDVLKLRTLSVMEGDDEVRQVTVGDDRVTRVGRILRRTSIDELPQLWNVLKGEMSVVGPRPHALVHDEQFSTMLEDYANRHQVKPGITGLAQVKGLRGETNTIDRIKARVDEDMAYVKSWSLWLDLKIIARTMVIVIGSKNAY